MVMKKSQLHVLWIDAYGKHLVTGKNMGLITIQDKVNMKNGSVSKIDYDPETTQKMIDKPHIL